MKVEVYNNWSEFLNYKIKECQLLGIEFNYKSVKRSWQNAKAHYKGKKIESKYLRQISSKLAKTESYFTEQEMIIGYVAPKYSELSKEEKEIWKQYLK